MYNLKVLFVCENNKYSVYSPIHKRQYKKRNIVQISKSLGIEGKKFFHHDILKLNSFFEKKIKYIKKKADLI